MLQGDFTRTGERKLAGVMKDGVNSANRYYLNRFRDAYRQAVIGKGEKKNNRQAGRRGLSAQGTTDFRAVLADLMMGLPVTEDLYSIFSKEKEHEEKEKESQRGAQEQVSLLLQTYMQLLLPDDEKFHGGWALINCDMRFVVRPPKIYMLCFVNEKELMYLTPVSVIQCCCFSRHLLLAHQPRRRIQ